MSLTTLSARENAQIAVANIHANTAKISRVALIISAHNESLVIAHTIRSAMVAGLKLGDIYVVDDASTDGTVKIARSILGRHNVMRVQRSGKGAAIKKITTALQLTKRYRWIHIADADGEFDERYFTELRKHLRVRHAAATGYVTSLSGGYISKYRIFEYAIGMDVIRRFQHLAKVITIIPGPTSIFRNDIFDKIEFSNKALCEDFDVTLQIHRGKLGSIQFIPSAVARTQDPAIFNDFVRQVSRWNRGVLQMFFKHKVGLTFSRIDAYLYYQVLQNILFFLMYFVWVPVVTYISGSPAYLALSFVSDVLLIFGFTLFAASRTGEYAIIPAFPIIYGMRWVSLGIFMKSFVEVVFLGRYRRSLGIWETVTRRAQATTTKIKVS